MSQGLLQPIQWKKIPDQIILKGNNRLAYRDPALFYHEGVFRIFVSIVTIEEDGTHSFKIVVILSRDLINWTKPDVITPSVNNLNFTAVGNVVRHKGKWVLCLSSYPMPPKGKIEDARAWTMESMDLETWSEPDLLRLKGPDVPETEMGRIIDPCIFRDRENHEKWWCAYKHGGLLLQRPRGLAYGGVDLPPTALLLRSMNLSFSYNLKQWTYAGTTDGEENYCMLVDADEYVLIYSPANGIGIKRSPDLFSWRTVELYTLGQRHWPWAQGRITAGHVLDLREEPGIGKYIMVFHGCSIAGKIAGGAHGRASLGIAWSDDLQRWHWPQDDEGGRK